VSRLPALLAARSETGGHPVIASRGRLAAYARAFADRPPLVVGSIVLVSAAVAAAFSLQVVSYEPDELGYTHLAMGIARSLSPFTFAYSGGQRLNQLYPLLIAPLWGAFGNVTAFKLVHVWNALLMASAAIPAYLLALEVMRVRWAAYLAAALVAAAPWLTLSTGELTEVAAYPASVWALLAMQRSLAAPSAWRDLLALLAIAVAAYGRLQLILLAPIFVIAMLVHELGYALSARDDQEGAWRELGRRIGRRHVVLSAVAVLGVVAGVPLLLTGQLQSAAGFYGDTVTGVTLNGATFDLARGYFSFIALGLGAVPAALAIGFVLGSFVAPVSRRAHAFASLAAVSVLGITLQVAEVSVRFNGATLQERYVFYIVPLLVVGMGAALLATRHPARVVLGGSIVLALLVGSTHYESQRTAFWYQASPGMTSFYDWIRPLFGASASPAADPGSSRQLVAGLVVLALGLLLAALVRRFGAKRLLAGVATLAIAFCATETVHALWRVVNGNASGPGFGSGSIRNADWVDRSVPGGVPVEQLVENTGGLDTALRVWEDDEFWNRDVVGAYSFGSLSDPYLPTTGLSLDRRSGALAPSAPGSPRYVVLPERGYPLQPVGTVVAHSPSGTIELMRLALPMRASWVLSGVSPDGWLRLDRGATLELYALRGAPRRCALVALKVSLDSIVPSARMLVLTGNGTERRVSLAPGATRTIQTRVCGWRDAAPRLSISAAPSLASADSQLTPRVLGVSVRPA